MIIIRNLRSLSECQLPTSNVQRTQVMMKILIVSAFVWQGIHCNSVSQQTMLHIHNRSQDAIDSIVFPLNNLRITKPVNPDDSVSITMHLADADLAQEGNFPMDIYQQGRKWSFGWGLHDFGRILKDEEHFYVFQHGISTVDRDLTEPTGFTIYVINTSKRGLDSLMAAGQLKAEADNEHSGLHVDYRQFRENPVIRFKHHDRWMSHVIRHDWDNWVLNQVVLYVAGNGQVFYSEQEARRSGGL